MTGALGYIGREVLRDLKKHNFQVQAIVRTGSDISPIQNYIDNAIFWNLTNKEFSGSLPAEIDCLYHLAAGTSGSHYEMMMNSVVATENLLQAVKSSRIKRFVLVSSFSVYKLSALKAGSVLDEQCPIEDHLSWRDSYTITKVRQENLVKQLCRDFNIPLVIIRPGKIYGPSTDPIPPQLGLNIPGLFFLHIGGRNILPLTHVSNCAQAIALAGIAKGIEGEAFNIVDDDLPTQKEFIKLYKKELGRFPRKLWIPYPLFLGLAWGFEKASQKTKGNIPPVITRYRAENLWKKFRYSNQKAKDRLEWRPEITTGQGLAAVLAGLKAEGKTTH